MTGVGWDNYIRKKLSNLVCDLFYAAVHKVMTMWTIWLRWNCHDYNNLKFAWVCLKELIKSVDKFKSSRINYSVYTFHIRWQTSNEIWYLRCYWTVEIEHARRHEFFNLHFSNTLYFWIFILKGLSFFLMQLHRRYLAFFTDRSSKFIFLKWASDTLFSQVATPRVKV